MQPCHRTITQRLPPYTPLPMSPSLPPPSPFRPPALPRWRHAPSLRSPARHWPPGPVIPASHAAPTTPSLSPPMQLDAPPPNCLWLPTRSPLLPPRGRPSPRSPHPTRPSPRSPHPTRPRPLHRCRGHATRACRGHATRGVTSTWRCSRIFSARSCCTAATKACRRAAEEHTGQSGW